MRWVVVINPHAGVSPTDPRSIEREVASHGLDAEVVTTDSPEDLDRILEHSPPGLSCSLRVPAPHRKPAVA